MASREGLVVTTDVPFPDDAAGPASALATLLADAEAAVSSLTAQVGTLTSQDADYQAAAKLNAATITTLTNQVQALEVQVVKPTLFGATPDSSDSAAGFAAMDAKYGVAAPVVRQFCTGAAVTPPAALAGRAVIGSWNSRGLGDAAYMAACKRSFFVHEIDHQWIQQPAAARDAYLASFIGNMNALHALDTTGSLGICITADALINTAKAPFLKALMNALPWVTHVAPDVDGISNAASYHSYDKELSAWNAFVAAYPQVTSWGVPEFGANRATNDPTGVVRAAWMAKYTGEFASMGAEYVTFWSKTTQTGSTFDTPAEIAVLQTRFQS